MQDYFISMYQILKAIETSSYSNSFNYDETLDLKKLRLTEEELIQKILPFLHLCKKSR